MRKIILIAFFLLFFLSFPKVVSASTLHLSPSSISIPIGSVKTVQVRLNTAGEAINGVSAYLSYPQDKVNVAYITGGSAFGIAAESTSGGGVVKISRGSISAVSGNVNVATIAFRGKAVGSGTAVFIGGSAAVRASDSSDSLNLGASTGTTFSIVAGTAAPTKSPTSSLSPTVSIDQDMIQPGITDLKITSVATNSATISWKTNEFADSTVEYGLDKDRYFLNIFEPKLTLGHTVVIRSSLLVPGVNLHFRVKSKDATGNESISKDMLLRLKGHAIKIKVTDTKSRPVRNARVILYSEPESQVTDNDGTVGFKDVTSGKHLVVVKIGNFETTREIEIKESFNTQEFEVEINKPDLFLSNISLILLIMAILITAGIFIFILVTRFKKKKLGNVGV